MINLFNNVLNIFFKVIRFTNYIIFTLFWFICVPIIYLYYNVLSRKKVKHNPYVVLFFLYVKISKLWKNIIF
jgi:hypothetical protein